MSAAEKAPTKEAVSLVSTLQQNYGHGRECNLIQAANWHAGGDLSLFKKCLEEIVPYYMGDGQQEKAQEAKLLLAQIEQNKAVWDRAQTLAIETQIS